MGFTDRLLFNKLLIAIKCISRHTHNLAGSGYVAKPLRQIEQTSFVFNDGVVSMDHESYLFVLI